MEIEGEDSSKVSLENGCNSNTVFGRGSGFNTKDTAVSRRHVLFKPISPDDGLTEPRVSFQVVGKNPVFIRSGGGGGGGEIKVFRSSSSGELVVGDRFCLSSVSPIWFTLKTSEEEEGSKSESEIDVSKLDPVKEFGFLVMGHEFDCYPVHRIREAKNWEWFLEEPGQSSDIDDGSDGSIRTKNTSAGKKRKKNRSGKDEGDDDWTGESDEDKELGARLKKVGRPKYSTRLKDNKKPFIDKGNEEKETAKTKTKSSSNAHNIQGEGDIEDEDDETLGGFIVDEEDDEGRLVDGDEDEEEFDEEDDEVDE